MIVESREWSRLGEDLTQERVHLASRMRKQLWRYQPFLKAVDDEPPIAIGCDNSTCCVRQRPGR